MSGLPSGADGRDRRPLHLRSGATFRYGMSHLMPNSFHPPPAFQVCGGVLPGKPMRASASLAQVAAPPTIGAPHLTVSLSPARFPCYPRPLSTHPNRFNTHRALVGPRFSTTDF